MFGPPAQEGMDLQLNPLHKREDAEEMELEEIEDPPAHPVTPPVRRQRERAPANDPGSRLLGGFGAVSVVLVYWCIGCCIVSKIISIVYYSIIYYSI